MLSFIQIPFEIMAMYYFHTFTSLSILLENTTDSDITLNLFQFLGGM